MSYDVIIVGAGAAGLIAAARLAQTGLQVLLVERNPRVGKKLLSTGNGRCNLSNTDMQPAYYEEAAPFVESLYETVKPVDVLDFLRTIGLMTAVEENRLYPRTFAASSVLDVLRNAIDTPNITLLTDTRITSLREGPDHSWQTETENGQHFRSRAILLSVGGNAAPKTGSDGSGYALLRALHLPLTPPTPALVQLKCAHPSLSSLKGIRTEATITLEIQGEPIRTQSGELLFTDYGVSGICIFQLSRYVPVALNAGKTVRLFIDFLPEIPADRLSEWLLTRLEAVRVRNHPLLSCFTGVFHRLLALAILKTAGLKPERTDTLSSMERDRLCDTIHAFPLPVTGTLGFENAQVTRGGLSRKAISPVTMSIRQGLYAAGEVIDCDGPCGGYNLHFAFASGLAAAEAIAAALTRSRCPVNNA